MSGTGLLINKLTGVSRLMVISLLAAVLVGVTLPFGLFIGSAKAFAGGDGSAETPYQISDCIQLQAIDESRNDEYELINDIDCSETVEWNEGDGFWPIAEGSAFTGSLDGNGYVISDLYINRPVDSYIGLFSGTAHMNTVIKDLGLENVNIVGASHVGALVGTNGDADSSSPEISNVYVTGTIESKGSAAGAIAGANYATVENSYARASVIGDTYDIGGLIGYQQEATLEDSYFAGTVSSENNDVFGLVGWNASGSVQYSFWDEDVSGIDTGSGADPGGSGASTAEMKNIDTFTTDLYDDSWDFGNVWSIYAHYNDGYPCLQWESGCNDEVEGDPDEEVSDDLNGDEIPDSEQPYVAAAKTVNNKDVVLEVDDSCEVNEALVKAETVNATQDSGYDYPEGLLNFTVDCGDPGYTTTVKQYYYGVTESGLIGRKFNPTTNAYFNITNSQLSVQTINGQTVTVLSFSITDGGELDIDGQVNGIIVDPSGLANQAVGTPNTGIASIRDLLSLK